MDSDGVRDSRVQLPIQVRKLTPGCFMENLSAHLESNARRSLDDAWPERRSFRREPASAEFHIVRPLVVPPLARDQHKAAKGGFFAGLRSEDRTDFESQSIAREFGAGCSLRDASGQGEYMHLVTSGVVCLYRTLSDGRRLVADFALPGDFVELRVNREIDEFADAMRAVETRRMSRDVFQRFAQARPGLRHSFRAEADRKRAEALDRMMLLARFNAREKIAAFIVHMQDSWQRVIGPSAYVALPMNRQDIGDFVGLSLETASRMFATFAREKLVVLAPGGLRMLDAARLRSIGRARG